MISITFNVGRDDMIAFSKAFQDHSPTVRAAVRRAKWIFPGIMLLGAAYYYFRYESPAALVCVIFGAIWVVFYPAYFRRHMLKATEKMLKESSHEKALGVYHVTLDEDGIFSRSPTGEGRYHWDAVDRVQLTSDHLHIFLAGPMGYTIRRSEVDEETIQTIKSFVEQRINK